MKWNALPLLPGERSMEAKGIRIPNLTSSQEERDFISSKKYRQIRKHSSGFILSRQNI